MKANKNVTPREEKQKKEEEVILEEVKDISLEKILPSITETKLQIAKFFDSIEERMSDHYKKHSNLLTAIKLEEKNLEDVHQIQVNADSLAALLEGQSKYKEEFDIEMAQQIIDLLTNG